jgi:hypothetical protein
MTPIILSNGRKLITLEDATEKTRRVDFEGCANSNSRDILRTYA